MFTFIGFILSSKYDSFHICQLNLSQDSIEFVMYMMSGYKGVELKLLLLPLTNDGGSYGYGRASRKLSSIEV